MKNFFYSILGVMLLASAQPTLAQNFNAGDAVISRPVGVGLLPGSGNEGADIESSILFTKIIPFLITWGINLAIGLSVIVLIFGGYLFLTAFGNEERHERGLKTIMYAVIGLVIALTAYGIVTIITRLQFS